MRLHGRVLAIGGSDSGGGAGIQADIKTLTALGAYAATAVTAITVQDAARVYAVHPMPPDVVAAQITRALADPGADAIKTGMLADAAILEAVLGALGTAPRNLVVDPVLRATSGETLLTADAAALRALIARARLITPNAPEAARLCGHPVKTLEDMRRAAAALLRAGAQAVLMKAGHLPGGTLTDLLITPGAEHCFTHPRQPGPPAHGTGCTLAAAIAAGLAQGMELPAATARAVGFVQQALRTAPGFGPVLNHAVTVAPFAAS